MERQAAMQAFAKYFKKSEFSCPCCGKVIVNEGLIFVLDLLRYRVRTPIIITSGYRCEKHNYEIGGVPGSKHLTGKAADFITKDIDPIVSYKILDSWFINNCGIGLYKNRVHFDVRIEKARWDYR